MCKELDYTQRRKTVDSGLNRSKIMGKAPYYTRSHKTVSSGLNVEIWTNLLQLQSCARLKMNIPHLHLASALQLLCMEIL